jgi:hypothetical protein
MITPSFGLTATERVLPRMALDFTTASLDPRVTFTRSGNTATVVNSSGYVVGINADLPRFDYNPITLACKGLLIEESRTNLVLQSQDFSTTWVSNSTVTTNTTVSPSNVQDADTLNATVADQVTQQTVTVANDTVTRTFSVFLKEGTAAKTTLRLLYQVGVATSAQISITWSTKVVTNDFSTVGLVFGAENYGNGWYRLYLAFANNGLGNTQAVCRILPAGAPIIGGTTGTVFAWGGQFEAGAFPTSYIPTTTATVTRNADVATMTGTNFSSWYNQTQGAFAVQAIVPQIGKSGRLFAVDAGSTGNKTQIGVDTTNQVFIASNVGGSFNGNTYTLNTVTANVVFNVCAAYSTSLSEPISLNAGAVQSSNFSVATTMIQIYLGSQIGPSSFLNGCLSKINYWPQRLIDAEIQAFSK